MRDALQGKVAIITGAGKGIGAGIAMVFAAQGATVLVADFDETWGAKSVARIKEMGAEASFVKVNVCKAEDVEVMAKTAIERYGRIDILCNNAGIYSDTMLVEEMTEAAWDKIICVNLKGAFLTSRAVIPQMLKQGHGRILFTSSITGPRTGVRGMGHYGASKGGINGYIKTLALELADRGITVNGVEPGNILTEGMIAEVGEEYVKANEGGVPVGHLGEPEDIAFAMLYLATDEAKFVTGQTIIVDGGQTLPESAWTPS